MENKKTLVGIIIVILLIGLLIAVSYIYNDFNKEQIRLLTEEANAILETDLKDYNTTYMIKTEKNYAEVEEIIKEYIMKLKNIYVEMEEMTSEINPNIIFSAQNLPNKSLKEVENIINEYKEKSQNLITEYDELITEEEIIRNINNANISVRQEYYESLYKEVMLSDVMNRQYTKLEEEIKNEKSKLYDKLNKVQKMKEFLEKNEESWTIEENKIQFKNANRIIEYYNLFNQIVD